MKCSIIIVCVALSKISTENMSYATFSTCWVFFLPNEAGLASLPTFRTYYHSNQYYAGKNGIISNKELDHGNTF